MKSMSVLPSSTLSPRKHEQRAPRSFSSRKRQRPSARGDPSRPFRNRRHPASPLPCLYNKRRLFLLSPLPKTPPPQHFPGLLSPPPPPQQQFGPRAEPLLPLAMGPGLYSDIGKKARDLLNKDFHTDQKFTLTTYISNGTAITAASTKKNEAIFSEIQAQLKQKNVTVDVKATSDSLLLTTVTIEELGVPGLKKIVTIPFPNPAAGKAEVQYLHDYAGINASFGLNTKPLVNLSGVFGTKAIAVGADVAYDTATGDFIKYNAGVNFTNTDLIASVTLNNKGDSLTASYYHLVNTEKNTAVGAEVTRSFSSKNNTVTFGTQHALDPSTTVKARYNSNGIASALIQHEWRPKSFFTLTTEVDTKAFEKSSKVGLSLVLKP